MNTSGEQTSAWKQKVYLQAMGQRHWDLVGPAAKSVCRYYAFSQTALREGVETNYLPSHE